MSKVRRVYWDASCFIAWLKKEKGRKKPCEEVLRAAERGELQIVTSALSLVEVVKGDKGPLEIPEEQAQKIRDFFLRSYIVVVQVSRKIAEDARSLIWSHGLRPRDAVHVATALFTKLDELHCFDRKLLSLDEKVTAGSLKIVEPRMAQGLLPLSAEEDDEEQAN